MENKLKKTLLINTIGEPGSGKSTLSFELLHKLKKIGIPVEYVPEVIKYDCFTDEGKQRIRSGHYDFKYLTLQRAMLEPLLGNISVVINDGCYENFLFYGKRRMSEKSFEKFKNQIENAQIYLNERAEPWYFMPTREHSYESAGRNENENESNLLRSEILKEMGHLNIHHVKNRDNLVEHIVQKLFSMK